MVSTLNQQLRSFPIESMAEIFPLYRQDYRLPPPINRCGFHGSSMKKIGSKICKKTSHSSVRSQFFPPFLLSPPCLQPLNTPHKPFPPLTNSDSASLRTHIHTSGRTAIVNSSLSPLQIFFFFFSFLCHRPPTLSPFIAAMPPEPSAQPPDHGRDHCLQ